MSEVVQFNARIRPNSKHRVKMDAARTEVTVDAVVEVMIKHFFGNNTAAERRALYRQHVGKAGT